MEAKKDWSHWHPGQGQRILHAAPRGSKAGEKQSEVGISAGSWATENISDGQPGERKKYPWKMDVGKRTKRPLEKTYEYLSKRASTEGCKHTLPMLWVPDHLASLLPLRPLKGLPEEVVMPTKTGVKWVGMKMSPTASSKCLVYQEDLTEGLGYHLQRLVPTAEQSPQTSATTEGLSPLRCWLRISHPFLPIFSPQYSQLKIHSSLNLQYPRKSWPKTSVLQEATCSWDLFPVTHLGLDRCWHSPLKTCH